MNSIFIFSKSFTIFFYFFLFHFNLVLQASQLSKTK